MAAVSLVSLANTYYDKGTTNEQRNSITAELQTLKNDPVLAIPTCAEGLQSASLTPPGQVLVLSILCSSLTKGFAAGMDAAVQSALYSTLVAFALPPAGASITAATAGMAGKALALLTLEVPAVFEPAWNAFAAALTAGHASAHYALRFLQEAAAVWFPLEEGSSAATRAAASLSAAVEVRTALKSRCYAQVPDLLGVFGSLLAARPPVGGPVSPSSSLSLRQMYDRDITVPLLAALEQLVAGLAHPDFGGEGMLSGLATLAALAVTPAAPASGHSVGIEALLVLTAIVNKRLLVAQTDAGAGGGSGGGGAAPGNPFAAAAAAPAVAGAGAAGGVAADPRPAQLCEHMTVLVATACGITLSPEDLAPDNATPLAMDFGAAAAALGSLNESAIMMLQDFVAACLRHLLPVVEATYGASGSGGLNVFRLMEVLFLFTLAQSDPSVFVHALTLWTALCDRVATAIAAAGASGSSSGGSGAAGVVRMPPAIVDLYSRVFGGLAAQLLDRIQYKTSAEALLELDDEDDDAPGSGAGGGDDAGGAGSGGGGGLRRTFSRGSMGSDASESNAAGVAAALVQVVKPGDVAAAAGGEPLRRLRCMPPSAAFTVGGGDAAAAQAAAATAGSSSSAVVTIVDEDDETADSAVAAALTAAAWAGTSGGLSSASLSGAAAASAAAAAEEEEDVLLAEAALQAYGVMTGAASGNGFSSVLLRGQRGAYITASVLLLNSLCGVPAVLEQVITAAGAAVTDASTALTAAAANASEPSPFVHSATGTSLGPTAVPYADAATLLMLLSHIGPRLLAAVSEGLAGGSAVAATAGAFSADFDPHSTLRAVINVIGSVVALATAAPEPTSSGVSALGGVIPPLSVVVVAAPWHGRSALHAELLQRALQCMAAHAGCLDALVRMLADTSSPLSPRVSATWSGGMSDIGGVVNGILAACFAALDSTVSPPPSSLAACAVQLMSALTSRPYLRALMRIGGVEAGPGGSGIVASSAGGSFVPLAVHLLGAPGSGMSPALVPKLSAALRPSQQAALLALSLTLASSSPVAGLSSSDLPASLRQACVTALLQPHVSLLVDGCTPTDATGAPSSLPVLTDRSGPGRIARAAGLLAAAAQAVTDANGPTKLLVATAVAPAFQAAAAALPVLIECGFSPDACVLTLRSGRQIRFQPFLLAADLLRMQSRIVSCLRQHIPDDVCVSAVTALSGGIGRLASVLATPTVFPLGCTGLITCAVGAVRLLRAMAKTARRSTATTLSPLAALIGSALTTTLAPIAAPTAAHADVFGPAVMLTAAELLRHHWQQVCADIDANAAGAAGGILQETMQLIGAWLTSRECSTEAFRFVLGVLAWLHKHTDLFIHSTFITHYAVPLEQALLAVVAEGLRQLAIDEILALFLLMAKPHSASVVSYVLPKWTAAHEGTVSGGVVATVAARIAALLSAA